MRHAWCLLADDKYMSTVNTSNTLGGEHLVVDSPDVPAPASGTVIYRTAEPALSKDDPTELAVPLPL